jgi:hypothetical protein
MSDRPLGIADVFDLMQNFSPPYQEHWYWCRETDDRTGKPHGAVRSDQSDRVGPYLPVGQLGHVCIRVGPYMSEDEAMHAGGLRRCMRCQQGWIRFDPDPRLRLRPSHPVWVHLDVSDADRCSMPLPVHVTPLGMEIEQ